MTKLEDNNSEKVEITDLEPISDSSNLKRLTLPRLTLHHRKISTALIIMIFMLTIGIMLFSISVANGRIFNAFFSQTSIPSSSKAQFYLQGNPSWGQFSIDGNRVAYLPIIGRDAPLSLALGSHQITWQAAPFLLKSCTLDISSPSVLSGTCPFDSNITDQLAAKKIPVILFFASLTNLPINQSGDLVQKVQTLFNSGTDTEVVSTGEFYATAQLRESTPSPCKETPNALLCYTQTNQSLLATLHLLADINLKNNDSCNISNDCLGQQDCHLFCSSLLSNQTGNSWNVIALVQVRWNYVTVSGQTVANNQPGSFIPNAGNDLQVSLRITYNTQGWNVQFSPGTDFSSPICSQATEDMVNVMGTAIINGQRMVPHRTIGSSKKPGEGCLMEIEPLIATSTPPSSISNVAYFLARFGVILAVNDIAHQLCPYLPVADPSQQSLVQNLLV